MHDIDDLKELIKKINKDIINCYEIENRTILMKNQKMLLKKRGKTGQELDKNKS